MRANSAKCLIPVSYSSLRSILSKQQQQQQQSSSSILFPSCRGFHSVKDNQHSWSVLKFIHQKQLKSAQKKFACFLLNVSEESYKSFNNYKYIWTEASLKVAVDGSANVLASRKLIHTADVVCGDFDSIDQKLVDQLRCPDTANKLYKPQPHQQYHQQPQQHNPMTIKMPQIIETPTQKETDFTKAIRVAMSKRSDINYFFALYHSDGSRIDHLFGLVNTLHLIKKNIILVNIHSNTISWLLLPGNHIIHKPLGRELCSLVPFTGPTEVKTQGLEYNIAPNVPLSFSGLISTSNICRTDHDSIIVETNRDLLWSIDL